MEVNQTVGCRGKNLVGLIVFIMVALLCFGGFINEDQTKQLTTKSPLTDKVIEQTLGNHGDKWKRFPIKIDAETAAQVVTNDYVYDDGDGLRWIIGTYKKEGATYLNILVRPIISGGGVPKVLIKKLPDMFAVACELYGDDGIDQKEFKGVGDNYDYKKGLSWRKVVGDNIIYVQLPKKDTIDFTMTPSVTVSIQKKSFVDWSNIGFIKFMLWGNQDVSVEEHISIANDITKKKAVPIKSCYIVNGDIVDTKKVTKMATLPDEKQMFSKLLRTFRVPKTGEYKLATIEDSSGKIEVIMPASPVSESEFKEYKYFVVYEYTTNKVRSFYLLSGTGSLNGPTFK